MMDDDGIGIGGLDGWHFFLSLTGAFCPDVPTGDHPKLCWKPWA